ncbi:HAD-IA family hydrolase [Sutcliffiella horikoshii]|uniref:HAD-IA family hydrolase n=1 Tax=Sutcliffiella horikoshii TaxID=79883 RepID=A0AA94WL52_9BACI|nr:HAD-IA family hydrolase [Sutcliffiella horikoshii]TYS57761.1 HAD-IA family hydrolase [Sutcliffiella horikoshii]
MIRAVIFDLDGTLLDRDVSLKKFVEDQYERYNQAFAHIHKNTYIDRFIELDGRGYVWKDKVYRQLIDEFLINAHTWDELLDDYIHHFPFHCTPFNNVESTLKRLSEDNLSLGMITNGFEVFQMNNLKALGIDHFFQSILVSEREGIKKPNPEIFRRAAERLQVSLKECLFVGDHPENDVKAAKAVCMTTVWKKDTYWDEVDADFIIEDLRCLPTIVKFINEKEGR